MGLGLAGPMGLGLAGPMGLGLAGWLAVLLYIVFKVLIVGFVLVCNLFCT